MPVYTGSRYVNGRVIGFTINGQVKRMLTRVDMLTEDVFENTEFREYTVVKGDRADTLASKFGGDSTLWWAILELNGFVGFPLDLTPGTKLRIPPRAFFEEL